jgi:hypothetical protein
MNVIFVTINVLYRVLKVASIHISELSFEGDALATVEFRFQKRGEREKLTVYYYQHPQI